jgi:hypothetical protein
MKAPLDIAQASADLAAIRHLTQQPGWAVLCARFDKGLEQLTAKVLDVTQDDVMATRLRHARAAVLEFTPKKLAENIETVLSAAIKRAERPPQQPME